MRTSIITSIAVIFLLHTLLIADAEILEFRAEPSPDRITLTWKTGQENNVKVFHVERSVNNDDFQKVGEVQPKGKNSSYEYIDDSISRIKTIYYYRLKVVNNNGTVQYSESLPVIPNVSSIRKTWGTIKALFR